MADWDEGNPGDSDLVSQFPANERAARGAVKSNFGVDHRDTVDADIGKHEKVTLLDQVSDPAFAAGQGVLYGKEADDIVELFYRDSDGTVRQITVDGLIALGTDNVATVNITDLNVTTGKLANAAVTNAKLRNSAGLSVIGRSANSTGGPADIVAGSNNQVLRRSGSTLAFGQVATNGLENSAVTTAKINDGAVTLAKMANLAASRIIGRASGAGTGVPTSLTAAQVNTITGLGSMGQRDVTISTGDPTGTPADGEIWLKREA